MYNAVYTCAYFLTIHKQGRVRPEILESQFHIDPRWQHTVTECLDILKVISVNEKQVTKGKLLGVVRERVFYLNTTTSSCRLLQGHAHSMTTCYGIYTYCSILGGQKQAQRISKMISICTSKG